jgi:hypothetical protein
MASTFSCQFLDSKVQVQKQANGLESYKAGKLEGLKAQKSSPLRLPEARSQQPDT